MKSISSKIIYSIVFAILVYLVMTVWGSKNGLQGALKLFDWRYLPLLLFLSMGNYLLRFIKWQYYLKILKVKVPASDSFIIHMSGLGLSITPGKLGEVIKSYFLKSGFGYSFSKTAPVVFADRLTDMMALVVLSAVGAIGFSYGQKAIWTIATIIFVIFLAIIIKPIGEFIIRALSVLPFFKKRAHYIRELYISSYILLKPRRIILPFFVSIISWSFEAVGFYFVFVSFGLHGFLAPFFIYSFSTIIGAISMLPGGLGATEGAITGLMRVLNIDYGIATLATMIIRATTLWFAVVIGVIYLLLAEKKYVRKN